MRLTPPENDGVRRLPLDKVAGKNIVAAVLVGVLALAPSLAHAQGAAAPKGAPKAEAKTPDQERFAAGKVKYGAEDYASALTEFQAADALVPTSELAMYIGLCLDRLGRSADAVPAYERFLAAPPATMSAAATQIAERVAKIKESLPPLPAPPARTEVPASPSTGAAPAASSPLPVAPSTQTAKPRSKVPAYITGSAAIAAAGIGAVFGILFLSDKNDFDKSPSTEKADSADSKALIADIGFGAAITLGVASVLF